MNTLGLVAAFVRRRPLTWAFHALTLSLGVAVLTALLALTRACRAASSATWRGWTWWWAPRAARSS